MPYRKGESGNPHGRPPDAWTAAAKERLREQCDPARFLIDVMRGVPLQVGDEMVYPNLDQRAAAARKLLDKLIPDAHEASTAVSLTLPTLTGPESVLTAMNSVVERVGSGAVTPTAATQVVALLAQYSRAYETSILEARVADLERGRPKREAGEP
jgi:predicted ArsR family transcriptional regulator